MLQKKVLLCLLLLAACNKQRSSQQKVSVAAKKLIRAAELTQLDSSSFAVLPFAENSEYLFKNAKPATLSAAEVSEIDSLLQKAIDAHNQAQEEEYRKMVKAVPAAWSRRDNYFINLLHYKRQFIPVINPAGEKEVWVNCFCGSMSDWRKRAVIVDDGGNCFFNIKINLTKANWYDLMVNGSA
jgi:predicted small secreted protein